MNSVFARLVTGATGLAGYMALVVWMLLSIHHGPASLDAVGVPLIMLGLCIICIARVGVLVGWWWSAKVNVSEG